MRAKIRKIKRKRKRKSELLVPCLSTWKKIARVGQYSARLEAVFCEADTLFFLSSRSWPSK